MNLGRRKSRKARAVDKLRGVAGGRRKSTPARMTDSVRDKVKRSGPAKTAQGAGMAARAAGRSGKAITAYPARKAAGKRAPLLMSLAVFAAASVAGFFAVRKMRRGGKQTGPAQTPRAIGNPPAARRRGARTTGPVPARWSGGRVEHPCARARRLRLRLGLNAGGEAADVGVGGDVEGALIRLAGGERAHRGHVVAGGRDVDRARLRSGG